jgi:1-phosphatidylinositol-3-phosphate 5-kinase
LNPNLRHDEIDPRHYIKIKRLASGTPQLSQYIKGIVINKNVMHKKMLRIIKCPRILFLTFPLEYTRIERQFTSLDPVLNQEK